MEGSNPYVVEKSGSRRSSVERREELLKVASPCSRNADTGARACGRSPNVPRPRRRRSTPGSGTSAGLFEELVRWQAERVDAVLAPSFERAAEEPSEVLRDFAVELQRLLLGDRAVVINRAAISEGTTDPTFAVGPGRQGEGQHRSKARALTSKSSGLEGAWSSKGQERR